MTQYTVLRVIAKIMIPVILLYGLYIQFHGEYSPGGGFQAGIIFAAGFVIYTLIYGLEKVQQAVPPVAVHILAAFGVFLFIAFGIAGMLMDGNFLQYRVFLEDNHAAETLGIIGIELGVGITVATVAIALFYSFAGREQD